jgi:hypothetical protein
MLLDELSALDLLLLFLLFLVILLMNTIIIFLIIFEIVALFIRRLDGDLCGNSGGAQ